MIGFRMLVLTMLLSATCACAPADSTGDSASPASAAASDAASAIPEAATIAPAASVEASAPAVGSSLHAEPGTAKSLLEVDPLVRNACRVQCTKNHAACRDTANSPEARNECFDTFNDCMDECG